MPIQKLLLDAAEAAVNGGNSFVTGTSPVYEAIAKQFAATEQVRGLLAATETDAERHERFTQAASQFLGCKPPKDLGQRMRASLGRAIMAGPVAPLPEKYDLRELGLVTPVRNQLSCGSCWNFSAVAAIESAHLLAGKYTDANTLNLSEQEVLSCGANGGCNGDWPETAFAFAKDRGLPAEGEVPYRASSGSGQCYSGQGVAKIEGYSYVGAVDRVPGDYAIKQALMVYGVVSVAVAVTNDWAAYHSGIYNGQFNSASGINHAVDIVGWETALDGRTVWVVRNSWDVTWGENGYMRCYSGANLIGFGASYCWVKAPAPVPVPPVPPAPVPPAPPVPPTPVAPVVFDVVLKEDGLFGRTIRGTATQRAASVAAIPHLDDFRKLAADVFALLVTGEAATVEAAVLSLIGKIRAGDYGAALMIAVATIPSVTALVGKLTRIVNEFRSHWTSEVQSSGPATLAAPPKSAFTDWLAKHSADIARLIEDLFSLAK